MYVGKNGELEIKSSGKTNINHEEHGIVNLPAGIYKKKIEQEFDYEQMESYNTRD